MESIALAIHDEKIRQEIVDFLKKFSDQEVELMSMEDVEDLRLLQKTRSEETMLFSDYLKSAN
jgi:hypothetical protein